MSSTDSLIASAAAAWKKKDAATTVAALEGALLLARGEAPLEVRVAVPVNHDHTGIGLYTPAKDGVVDGRRVRLYVEVANFKGVSVATGAVHVQLDVTGDFSFEEPKGGVTALQQGVSLGTQAFDTRTFLGLTSLGVEINLGEKSPAGVYRVALHVKDAIGNRTASKDARFVLR